MTNIKVGSKVSLEVDIFNQPRWNYGTIDSDTGEYNMEDCSLFSPTYVKTGLIIKVKSRTSHPNKLKALIQLDELHTQPFWQPFFIFNSPSIYPGGPVVLGGECECGADKVYGLDNKVHSYWCPKHGY